MWFQSIVKQQSFYDEHANGAPIRRYFYNIDLQGRLFVEDTLPKVRRKIRHDLALNRLRLPTE